MDNHITVCPLDLYPGNLSEFVSTVNELTNSKILGQQVAVAPSLKSSRVQTIMELDEEIDMALPSAADVGVDLSVLQSFLTPQEHCQEEDVAWDVEHELQIIASEMRKEIEEREGSVLPGQVSPKRKQGGKEATRC